MFHFAAVLCVSIQVPQGTRCQGQTSMKVQNYVPLNFLVCHPVVSTASVPTPVLTSVHAIRWLFKQACLGTDHFSGTMQCRGQNVLGTGRIFLRPFWNWCIHEHVIATQCMRQTLAHFFGHHAPCQLCAPSTILHQVNSSRYRSVQGTFSDSCIWAVVLQMPRHCIASDSLKRLWQQSSNQATCSARKFP